MAEFQMLFTQDEHELLTFLDQPWKLLIVSAHGFPDDPEISGSHTGKTCIHPERLRGEVDTVILVACSQSLRNASIWARQLQARRVFFATEEVQGEVGARSARHVGTPIAPWDDNERILRVLRYGVSGRASKKVDPGWTVLEVSA